MALKDKFTDGDNKNETQTPNSSQNDQLQTVMNQLTEIQASLNQIRTNSPKTQMSLSVADKLQNQQDLLMKGSTRSRREGTRQNKRHDELITTIETTASNFNQATEITQKAFYQCSETLY